MKKFTKISEVEKIVIFILLLLLTFSGFSQPLLKQPNIDINKEMLIYHPKMMKSNIYTIRSYKYPFKLTIKPGVNRLQTNMIDRRSLQDFDVEDAFEDVNFVAIVRYDVRLKIYLKNRHNRIILRAFIQEPKSVFTIGFQRKF